MPFAPPGSALTLVRPERAAARRSALGAGALLEIATSFFVFFSGPRPAFYAPARRRPRPRRSRPRRSRRSLFGACTCLLARSLPLHPAHAQRDVAHALRGEVRGDLHVPRVSYAPSAYVSHHPPACSALPATTRRRPGWCPSSFLSSFFVTRSVVLPPQLRRSRRGRPNATGARRVFSCVSVVVTTFRRSSRVPQRTGGPVRMGSPSRFAPSAWDVLGSVDVSAAPARVILAQPGVQGLGWGGVSALRDATRANDEVASFGSQRVRSRRRRSVGGESGAWNHAMAPKKPRRASRVRRGTNGARFAGRQQSLPAVTPQHRSRANARRPRLFAAAKNRSGASERAARRRRRRRERTVTARRRCAPSSVTASRRAPRRAGRGYPPGLAELLPADVLIRHFVSPLRALFEEDLFASKVFFAPSRDDDRRSDYLKLDFDERRR